MGGGGSTQMDGRRYFKSEVETMDRDGLDAVIDERIAYTVRYAAEHSAFYRSFFRSHSIDPKKIKAHEDLIELPIISSQTIRQNQPPETPDFRFMSAGWENIFTVHETSGTSGTPKSFFLTWEDWRRYAEKYARIFVSQGLSSSDRLIVCASYGMNVGANTMTLAARDIGITIIPVGKCTFPLRLYTSYNPTAIVGSVFKLLHLAERMRSGGINPSRTSLERLIVGGESFAPEARDYLSEVYSLPVYNTYGSTEGTMCGECDQVSGLHVPEDLVHMDVYDPGMHSFVPDGECGRIVLTTLLPPGGKCGTLLLNYDTEDTTVVISRKPCACGRTHMRILNPQREAETVWVFETPFNRVDIERGVFQRENLTWLSGEYEAFIYGSEDAGEVTLRVSMEAARPEEVNKRIIEDSFLGSFLKHRQRLSQAYADGSFKIVFHYAPPGGLELSQVRGRPRRLVDRRG